MQVVLDNPYILMTDHKILSPSELTTVYGLIAKSGRPLLLIADEVAPACIIDMLARRERDQLKIAAIHPPEYGHWRKALLEDIAVATGGKVIARDLGGSVDKCELADLGSARQVRISAERTLITAGNGNQVAIDARREQIKRQYDAAPENIERDKFQERLAKLAGGTAIILAGGATPVEQKRRVQLIEDSINATRAALEEGVVPGGGVALIRAAPALDPLIASLTGSARQGAELLQRALTQPLFRIAVNCGLDGKTFVNEVAKSHNGVGLDARTGSMVDLVQAGIIDPVKVSYSAVRNAASVAALILTTQTLIAKKPDDFDPTAAPARGGGAEFLGRARNARLTKRGAVLVAVAAKETRASAPFCDNFGSGASAQPSSGVRHPVAATARRFERDFVIRLHHHLASLACVLSVYEEPAGCPGLAATEPFWSKAYAAGNGVKQPVAFRSHAPLYHLSVAAERRSGSA
jgi:chaperonin GroEL